jgi:hypothetical protein
LEWQSWLISCQNGPIVARAPPQPAPQVASDFSSTIERIIALCAFLFTILLVGYVFAWFFYYLPKSELLSSEAEQSAVEIFDPAADKNLDPGPSGDNLCRICLNSERNILFDPCHHILTCIDCSRTVHICPLCKENIEKRTRVYLA